MNKRYLIGKKDKFANEKIKYFNILKSIIKIEEKDIEVYNGYDAIGLKYESDLLKIIFSNITDVLKNESELSGTTLAFELQPGQFDQRADAVSQLLNLFRGNDTKIITSTIIQVNKILTKSEIKAIYQKIINPLDYEVKDLNQIGFKEIPSKKKIFIIDNFIKMSRGELAKYYKEQSFSFNIEDLEYIQEYFISIGRNPNILEIKMLDTYWSDHCRHTTFLTEIENIMFGKTKESLLIQQMWKRYIEQRTLMGRKNPITLMDMATHGTRVLKFEKKLNDLDESLEINANSFKINVDIDGKDNKYLLMFKNETHNHPTEIEPFGGASTCLGGAIRDTLSGRCFTFQGMRITGAASPFSNKVIDNKLPQSYITRTAAEGFSSYGNQIGIATPFIKEYYNEGFLAKRLETGFVVGAVKASAIKREEPILGDIIMLVGGLTGRDGIGGATGSSKQQTTTTNKVSAAEVQKGNAIVERKIQRLTKNYSFTKLIKRSNDFGAGGICVAIVELAESIEIHLEKVPLKYKGMSPLEIALSESQERMAYVIDPKDKLLFEKLCKAENLVSTQVAEVKNNGKITMKYNSDIIFQLDSSFISSNGRSKKTNVLIEEKWDLSSFKNKKYSKKEYLNILGSLKIASQRGIQEMFDSSIGRGTVVAPYGGIYQASPSQVSAQKIPTPGFTNTVSVTSHGYVPDMALQSPYLAGQYAVVLSISKLIASGVPLKNMKASYQEYFEKMETNKQWSKPIQSLLGTLEAQLKFEVPSIGGKDSMSGTYKKLTVPPSVIAFAINVTKAKNIITSELKQKNSNIYLIDLPKDDLLQINLEKTKHIYKELEKLIKDKKVNSSFVIEEGGWLTALTKMSFGNRIGFNVKNRKMLKNAFSFNNGSILIETTDIIEKDNFIFIGETQEKIKINNDEFIIERIQELNEKVLEKVFPLRTKKQGKLINKTFEAKTNFQFPNYVKVPKVLIPIFPGTNCEYDLTKAFEAEGAKVEQLVINNINNTLLNESKLEFIKKLKQSHILCIPGGFSASDEPDGSGKFISVFMRLPLVRESIEAHIEDKKLIIGICNGFQALIKTGLVPYGKFVDFKGEEPTLYKNLISKHVAKFVTTKVASNNSPWTINFKINSRHILATSHGEGRVIIKPEEAKKLFDNGQIPFQYVDLNNIVTMDSQYNPNGSMFAIESMTSIDGLILGKMAHSERYEKGNFKNIYGNKEQEILKNGILYFQGVK